MVAVWVLLISVSPFSHCFPLIIIGVFFSLAVVYVVFLGTSYLRMNLIFLTLFCVLSPHLASASPFHFFPCRTFSSQLVWCVCLVKLKDSLIIIWKYCKFIYLAFRLCCGVVNQTLNQIKDLYSNWNVLLVYRRLKGPPFGIRVFLYFCALWFLPHWGFPRGTSECMCSLCILWDLYSSRWRLSVTEYITIVHVRVCVVYRDYFYSLALLTKRTTIVRNHRPAHVSYCVKNCECNPCSQKHNFAWLSCTQWS